MRYGEFVRTLEEIMEVILVKTSFEKKKRKGEWNISKIQIRVFET
jgi:hypothetical protein